MREIKINNTSVHFREVCTQWILLDNTMLEKAELETLKMHLYLDQPQCPPSSFKRDNCSTYTSDPIPSYFFGIFSIHAFGLFDPSSPSDLRYSFFQGLDCPIS